jgi:hypothetical protein
MSEKYSPELIHRLSKTTLHAAERGRRSLFEKLTAQNAERIAEMMKEKPQLWEQKEGETKLLLDPEIAELMPQEFFDNPTAWIERQNNIERHHSSEFLPTGETIQELWHKSYDISKVKEFTLENEQTHKSIKIISKRIEKEEVEEVARARQAFEAGIPTPRVWGEIFDKGNAYAFFEKIEGVSLLAAFEKTGLTYNASGVANISHAVTEEAFWKGMALSSSTSSLPDEVKQALFIEWQKEADQHNKEKIAFTLRAIYYDLKSAAAPLGGGEIIWGENLPFSQKDQDQAVQVLGFNTVREFYDEIRRINKVGDWKVLDKIEIKLEKLMLQQNEEEADLFRKKQEQERNYEDIIFSASMGIPVYKAKAYLRELCEEKRIEHKDFADRNLMIDWDIKNDKPKPGAKMYLIDWEQKVSSQKNNLAITI